MPMIPQTEASPHFQVFVGVGTTEPVLMQKDAIDCMFALLVLRLVSQESSTRHLPMIAPRATTGITGRGFSSNSLSTESWGVKWDTGNLKRPIRQSRPQANLILKFVKYLSPPQLGTTGLRMPWGMRSLPKSHEC